MNVQDQISSRPAHRKPHPLPQRGRDRRQSCQDTSTEKTPAKQTDGIEQRWRHLVVVVVSCLENNEAELTELQVGVQLEKA